MTDTTDTAVSESTDEADVSDATPEDAIPDAPLQGSEPDSEPEQDDDEPDTFSRDYVEGLRQENGRWRQKAQRADELAQRLHAELVRATGKLADPTDLPFDENHLTEPDKMAAAIEDLLTRKPHLAARRPTGDIGQGPSPTAAGVDLAAILRGKAG
ncbi:hypothetical protein NGTWS0302_16880 [Mycolicibacterium cyprinidarum]|uniref:Scaffolding protein n=1 Tax=Mycolicibacterium cyprinidarum TaxID=2860311 RepID=A0ABQ4VBE3_9MYCO|nr:hypothetical protein NGTWS1702_24670 [Mycolicibacterium sp. NGTWSNA01]GJF18546.1 hypothetical protein NGTWS0302_16880 [Mycolicibacterium sp. NGTWS0302]